MDKLAPTDLRGFEAEHRLITLARSLKHEHFVRSVRKASLKLDKHGIDVIIFVRSLYGGKDIKVPVQVKSSQAGASDFQKKHPLCIEAGVIIMVVNDQSTDDMLITRLKNKLEDIQWHNKDYTEFFQKFVQ